MASPVLGKQGLIGSFSNFRWRMFCSMAKKTIMKGDFFSSNCVDLCTLELAHLLRLSREILNKLFLIFLYYKFWHNLRDLYQIGQINKCKLFCLLVAHPINLCRMNTNKSCKRRESVMRSRSKNATSVLFSDLKKTLHTIFLQEQEVCHGPLANLGLTSIFYFVVST